MLARVSQPEALQEAVWACLDLAWSAMCAGTVPVGAVLVNGLDEIVATGRSRMYETSAPPPEIANSLLAHAEVNALIGLTPDLRYVDHHLVTTLEPCVLCMGAAAMATVGAITFLGADLYGGASSGFVSTPHTARVPVDVFGPRADGIGRLAAGLHVAFYLHRKPTGQVIAVHRELAPVVVAVAERLIAADVFGMAAAGTPWRDARVALLEVV